MKNLNRQNLLFLILFLLSPSVFASEAIATFAGGCFWCMQGPFDKTPGVISTLVGFSGGTKKNPGYYEVASGKTDHKEAIQVKYDPTKVTYLDLLRVFWTQIDPTDTGGQFADQGPHYQTAIYFHNEKQKKIALKSKDMLSKSKRFSDPIYTPLVKYKNFYPAGNKHQKYYEKSPFRYNAYKIGSGRARFIKKHWKGFVTKQNK